MIYLFVYERMHTWQSEDNLWKSVLSFHHVVPGIESLLSGFLASPFTADPHHQTSLRFLPGSWNGARYF